MIRRIYVEKKNTVDIASKNMLKDLRENLLIRRLEDVRIFIRYDVEGLSEEVYEKAKHTIFSEPQVDKTYDDRIPEIGFDRYFEIEALPGQYDQRADFASQCLQMLTQGDRPEVRAGRLIALKGDIAEEDFAKIKAYCVNPVEAHEVPIQIPTTIRREFEAPSDVPTVRGFIEMDDSALNRLLKDLGLAMNLDDLRFCREYFRSVKRDPSLTEIRVLDTYWADHCRHTTFHTHLDNIEIQDPIIQKVFEQYISDRNPEKPITLMNLALAASKKLHADGLMPDWDISEENNACSIAVDADIDGKKEPWLIMFKNETHNHPTEIEPFGGAATCLGGAIRDPLSGRAYPYQSMRVTGSADPRRPISETIPGKLPQRKLTTTAAHGFSSYGNQIGLATGLVNEIYDEGYLAKRMEVGAVVAAAPRENVVRERPSAGDLIILLGGRTGRDGCGGATGSSKAHDEQSLTSCGSEVQKGNAPEEHKLKRLFRNNEATKLIKRCNDFGAGGVSVAIGELADGLEINLDKVPKKYDGLDGTELSISESQERMAVVVDAMNAHKFIDLASEENLEATVVARVTAEPRLVMKWRDKVIVDISREFLNSNGAAHHADAVVAKASLKDYFTNRMPKKDVKRSFTEIFSSLNVCSQQGLVEQFDNSIGAGTVLMPYGGKEQLTPSQVMAAKLPVRGGNTTTATVMSYGYSPTLSKISPFHGAMYAVLDSIAKLVASGGNFRKAYLSFQEYFEKLGNDPSRWGKPLAALLGAHYAQLQLGRAAIGGKDSMSGSYLDLDVPPTLISFAITPADANTIISNELKYPGHRIVLIEAPIDSNGIPDFKTLRARYDAIHKAVLAGKVYSAFALGEAGLCEIAKMGFGNLIGIDFKNDIELDLFKPAFGSIVLEITDDLNLEGAVDIAQTTFEEAITMGEERVTLDNLIDIWQEPLENVFPSRTTEVSTTHIDYMHRNEERPAIKIAKPRVFIPVFPGTNCEYDSAAAFEKHGAICDTVVLRNLTSSGIEQSIERMARGIEEAQIVMLPGGFSAGDEPDGSGKFIATTFRNPRIKEAIDRLLKQRDGLMLGICNGFQALVKLGLVPYGEIRDTLDIEPTLTYNTTGHHMARMVTTKVVSILSPWMMYEELGNEHVIPISHGEGRFIAGIKMIDKLAENGQIATQYIGVNPNGSTSAIEGITSPDGRVFGKMAHSERCGNNVAKNIVGDKTQDIFRGGIDYFA